MNHKISLLNIEIDDLTMQELLAQFDSGIVITPNVDHLVKLQKDREFYDAYQMADYVVLDSRVLRYLMKMMRKPIRAVIPGSDLLPAFCEYHRNNLDVKVFLLGAAPGVAHAAMQRINAKIGRDIVVGAFSPSFGFENDIAECHKIIHIINGTDANALAIGVGAPKQEKWLAKHFDSLTHIKMAMAIGATIDFEAGNIQRAPLFMQKMCMEWMYRLTREPKRLWRRYLLEDTGILMYVTKQMFGMYSNPFS